MKQLDLKAEILAAEWIEAGIAEDSIVIKSHGALHRSQRSDVVNQQLDEDDTLFATERHVLYTSREGLYDMLPQSLFHLSSPPKNANSREVLDYFKQHKTEEKNARLFFLPFETGINHAKIANAVSELTLQKRGDDARLKNMFARYWPILKMMSNSQGSYFLKLLPMFHQIRGNKNKMEEVLSTFLDLPVEINATPCQKQRIENGQENCNFFGQILGVNFIPGEPYYFDGEDKLQIKLGPVNNLSAAEFLNSNSKKYKLLHSLCDYLLPVEMDWGFEIIYQQQSELMTLPDDSSTPSEILLGVNSLLG